MEFPSYLHLARGHWVHLFCTRQLSKPSVVPMGMLVHKAIKTKIKLPIASFIFTVLCKNAYQCFLRLNQVHCPCNYASYWKSCMLKSTYNTAQSYSTGASRYELFSTTLIENLANYQTLSRQHVTCYLSTTVAAGNGPKCLLSTGYTIP